MTENKFKIGDTVTLSITALEDTRFMNMVSLDPASEYIVKAIDVAIGNWFYQVSKKLPTGATYTEPIYMHEDYLVPKVMYNAVQPDHYNADDDNDLIAMWSKIMKPNEFRRTMYSHISKYLYRYPDKKYDEDFNKAKEYIRRLEKWEHETGQFGNEGIK